ncbi:hypothetical protein [Oleidesulfovibrio sp.]|uniref:hypothetical protein n=1 Tax=Oleidesulfovibrio sp. TaxID=2909707 RepID=UPI003A8BE8E1
MELDHIFICTTQDAPAAEAIINAIGLIEGSSNRHLGQGTVNKRFFFHNFMLELLWVETTEELERETTKPIGLKERFTALSDAKISPFGLIFRPSVSNQCPFQFRSYHPDYLPAELDMKVASQSPLCEPSYVFIDFIKQTPVRAIKEPILHPAGIEQLTSATITVDGEQPLSKVAEVINLSEGVTVESGPTHVLELCFDNCRQKRHADLRPHLPLTINW